MGPLTYFDKISSEWNYVLAMLIGFMFGYILEASGFSSSRKLAGVFYGYDFAVIQVFFTAVVVAIIGLLYMGYFGWIDYSVVFVHPTYLNSAIVGGVIMGFGFIMGGFCPGTSLTAVAIGKLDGWVFTGGLVLGIFLFTITFPLIEKLYYANDMGHVRITDVLGIKTGWFTFIFTSAAVAIFYATTLIRRRIKPVDY